MTNRNKLALGVVVACIFAVAMVVLTRPTKPSGTAKDKVTVRLKWVHQAQFAGFYYADKAGFYGEEGLSAELLPGGVDFPAVQMVSSGTEDFGVTGADQILLARDKGVPIVAIAVVYRKSPFVLFSLKKSGIAEPKDFVGKKVGVKLGGNEELTYRAMMKGAGVETAKVNEIPVKYDLSPLLTGQVDVWPGYSINEPITAEENGHEVTIMWPERYGVRLYADTLFTREDMIKNKPDLVKRFIRATIRGWREAMANQEQAVSYVLQYSDSLKRPHETAMLKASVELVDIGKGAIGDMEKPIWSGMETFLREQGVIKKPVDVDSAFTTQFLQ